MIIKQWNRRGFLAGVQGLAIAAFARPAGRLVQAQAPALHPKYPLTDPETAYRIVLLAHSDPAEVRRMVERQPSLARASWDWGYGDWETALGAASHTGRRDIAEVLLAHGARPTIFSAAMLGQLDVVKAFVAASPGIQRTLGPHGLTLLSHARAGGPPSAPVVAYLESVGDADRRPPSAPLSNNDRAALVGRYQFGLGPSDWFDVDVRSDQLGLQRPGTSRRFLIHTGDLMFFPSGVPSVKITFAREAGRVIRLTIADPDVLVTASRTA